MKALTLLALILMLAVPQVAHSATMYYLVQVDGGQTISVFGNYSTLEQCLAELKKEKARGTTGLQCQVIGGSAQNNPHAVDSSGQTIDWYLVGLAFSERYEYDVVVFGGPYTYSVCTRLRSDVGLSIINAGYKPRCITRGLLKEHEAKGLKILWR